MGTPEPARRPKAADSDRWQGSTGQSAEILLVDVAGRCLVVEGAHEGGSAVLGDGAFTAPGGVEALGGVDVAGRGHPIAVPDRCSVAMRIVLIITGSPL